MGKANAMGGAANMILNIVCYSVVFVLFCVHSNIALKVHELGVSVGCRMLLGLMGCLFWGRDYNSSRSAKYFLFSLAVFWLKKKNALRAPSERPTGCLKAYTRSHGGSATIPQLETSCLILH